MELEYRTLDILANRLYYTEREIIDWMPTDDFGTILAIVHDYERKIYIVMQARLGRTQGIRTHQYGRFKSEKSARIQYEKFLADVEVSIQTLTVHAN